MVSYAFRKVELARSRQSKRLPHSAHRAFTRRNNKTMEGDNNNDKTEKDEGDGEKKK